jgi:hypothetical protein
MAITTYLHFVGPIAIPNTAPSVVGGANLVNLIEKYEAKFLEDVLGYKLYDLLMTNINEGSGIYHDLLVGKAYTDSQDINRYWKGFREIGTNPIANYIYCEWQKQNFSQTTSLGERRGKFENMTDSGQAQKYKDSWNDMVDMLIVMDDFLTVNKADYTNYIGETFPIDCNYSNYTRPPSNSKYFKHINLFF